MAVTVHKEKCPQNHPCPSVRVCPTGALRQSGFRAPEVDTGKCTDCSKCMRFCPMGVFTADIGGKKKDTTIKTGSGGL